MSSYVNVIIIAVACFPIVAALCSVPYLVYEYRRYGSIPVWKSILVFGFIFYLLCAFYLVILPLPADTTAVYQNAVAPQLVPFNELRDISISLAHAGVSLTSPASWVAGLKEPAVYQLIFNFCLMVPLGMFARYFWHRSWWQAWLMGLVVSLFFELTQLTGLWGLYAHPYRLFDVDDLIVNSTGALLGFWLAIPLERVLPDLDVVNARAIERGRLYPSFMRRLVALGVDLALDALVMMLFALLWPQSATFGPEEAMASYASIGICFMLVPIITRGQTLGHKLLRMRIVRPDASPAPWWAYVVRYGSLFWVFLMAPAWVVRWFVSGGSHGVDADQIVVILGAFYLVWGITVLFRAVVSRIGGQPFVMANGYLSDTRLMSLAQVEAIRTHTEDAGIADEPGTYVPDGQVYSEDEDAEDGPRA